MSRRRATSPFCVLVLLGSSLLALAAQRPGGRAEPIHSASPLAKRWHAEANQTDANLGNSVGTAGDVNGDGYDDVIVGAFQYSNGETYEGRALLYLGSATGPSATPDWTAESDQVAAHFGNSVGTAGDVNGDGYDDVIVGAYLYDHGQFDEGRAFLYLGSASGLSSTPSWTAESDQANAWFGNSVGTAGDVNGDGYDDVIVGAYFYDGGQINEGRAFLYLGSATGPSATPDWTAESDQADAWYGISVGTAGDVNGDGYDDVIAGAPFYTNDQYEEGRVFLYLGSASGPSATADWTAESDQITSDFGTSVGTAGDVNGDGYDDVIVGAYAYDNGQGDEGRAFLYLGSATGPSATSDWTAESNQGGSLFGISVGTAGDVNGDGYDDVIVGATRYDHGQSDEGAVAIYQGSATGPSPTPDWTAESNQAGALFGGSLGTAGDVNADGYDEVIVGADVYEHGQPNEGVAFVLGPPLR